MLLFQKRFHAGLVSGDVTLTFRAWDKPRVKPGGRYRCHPIGVLEVNAIERVPVASISEEDARRAGFASRAELVGYLAEVAPDPERREVWRIELHHGGDGDRVSTALDTNITPEQRKALEEKLARMDASSSFGPWTLRTLRLIEKHPKVPASLLAAKLGRPKLDFKASVVKLKKLGLTQSFEVGYELSPRGRAFLAGRSRGGSARRDGRAFRPVTRRAR